MLCLQVVYKNKEPKTRVLRDKPSFDTIESQVRRLCQLPSKPLLITYQEADQPGIILLDDDDVRAMLAGLAPSQTKVALTVCLRSASFAELGNVQLIQRCWIKELKHRHSKRDVFARKKFTKDLKVLRRGLISAKLNPKTVDKIVRRVNVEVEKFFIERELEGDGNAAELPVRRAAPDPFSDSKSSIVQVSKSCPSLFSDSEVAFRFNKLDGLKPLARIDSDTRHCDDPEFGDAAISEEPEEDTWVDFSEEEGAGPAKCLNCKRKLTNLISFKCFECDRFELCGECVRGESIGHVHVLRPSYQMDETARKVGKLESFCRRVWTGRGQREGWNALLAFNGRN